MGLPYLLHCSSAMNESTTWHYRWWCAGNGFSFLAFSIASKRPFSCTARFYVNWSFCSTYLYTSLVFIIYSATIIFIPFAQTSQCICLFFGNRQLRRVRHRPHVCSCSVRVIVAIHVGTDIKVISKPCVEALVIFMFGWCTISRNGVH